MFQKIVTQRTFEADMLCTYQKIGKNVFYQLAMEWQIPDLQENGYRKFTDFLKELLKFVRKCLKRSVFSLASLDNIITPPSISSIIGADRIIYITTPPTTVNHNKQ